MSLGVVLRFAAFCPHWAMTGIHIHALVIRFTDCPLTRGNCAKAFQAGELNARPMRGVLVPCSTGYVVAFLAKCRCHAAKLSTVRLSPAWAAFNFASLAA